MSLEIGLQYPIGTVVDSNEIPSQLKESSQWVIWRGQYDKRNPDKPKKVPLNAMSLEAASAQTSKNWLAFEEVLNVLVSRRAELSEMSVAAQCPEFYGLGYVLTEDDGFTCIDLDGVVDSPGDVVAERYRRIVSKMNSYTEWSPSKKGLHIWVKAKLPVPGRNGEIEMYCSKRYITVTGDDYHGA